ncbi:MAG: flagellar motor stator protein MotA [Alphaproteobacteria bacterium]|nr:flagellar motor stator protein MotA [Alphaproteobacteria bacterium]
MKLLGLLLVFGCTFGGLILTAGMEKAIHLLMAVILPATPGEALIIMGCAIAAFLVANTVDTVKGTMKYFGSLIKPLEYNKSDYIELLSMLFTVFKLARTKGFLALEQHVENPHESELFAQFPKFHSNHHAEEFLCDYLRMISLGIEDPAKIGGLMDKEIAEMEHHETHPGHAVHHMAEGIPALGIVAAVLGVIKTMASISEPPEVLGKLIGSALVGTFLGVWLSYGIFGPIALAMIERAESKVLYFKVIKVGTIAYLEGAAPQVAIEFARKIIPHNLQPSFIELEEILNELPAPTA